MSFTVFRLDQTVAENATLPTNLDLNLNLILEPDPNEFEDVKDPPDLPMPIRINLAHQAWIQGKGTISIGQACRPFGVNPSTLHGRIHGAVPKAIASQAMQRLSAPEEKAIRDWILELSSWGWPIRIERLRQIATNLLVEKGDTRDLGVHWTDQFLARHPDLRSKFVEALDKERAKAQDIDILQDWFELYKATCVKYNIKPRNRHNVDEKGLMMGFIGKVRVIISKYEKKVYMTQPGNREWVSLIECISLDGRRTRL